MTLEERIKKLTAMKEKKEKAAAFKKQIEDARKGLAALRNKK